MAFKTTAVNTSGTAPVAGVASVGGRYAGIRPRAAGPEKVRAGEYVQEGVKHYLSRSGGTIMIEVLVRQAEGEKATAPSDNPRLVMLNFAGKSYDSGIERVVQLAMAICNCETIEQFNAEEPHWDELVDILCGKRTQSEHYPEQPLVGRKFWARGRNATRIGDDGEPFINWHFGIAAD